MNSKSTFLSVYVKVPNRSWQKIKLTLCCYLLDKEERKIFLHLCSKIHFWGLFSDSLLILFQSQFGNGMLYTISRFLVCVSLSTWSESIRKYLYLPSSESKISTKPCCNFLIYFEVSEWEKFWHYQKLAQKSQIDKSSLYKSLILSVMFHWQDSNPQPSKNESSCK